MGINIYEIAHGIIRKCSVLLFQKQRVNENNVHCGYVVSRKTPLFVYLSGCKNTVSLLSDEYPWVNPVEIGHFFIVECR